MRRFFATLLLVTAAACSGADGQPGVTATCLDSTGQSHGPCRVFRGRLKLPPADQLHLFAGGFQVVAVTFVAAADPGPAPDAGTAGADAAAAVSDGGPGAPPAELAEARLFLGPVFAHEAGGGQRPDVPFSVVLPCDRSASLVLQVPHADVGQPGLWVASMTFAAEEGGAATATLIPYQPADACGSKTNALDLGQVTLQLASAGLLSSGAIVLGKDGSRNPLDVLDTDGDGTTDLADPDDDDDGQIDAADADAEGDGIADAAQGLTALADQDTDGVPDLFQ